ncbi:MAG: NuoI/complex I 23 kDa subunit family protein [Planctomycetota bacterium]|jgi:formate hydrogenlyase subunit 6/NADH:ubiquinone oxidoreductase subunit I
MTAVALYFRHISEAVTSIFEGMSVTFSHLFRKPITIQYPDKTPKPVVHTLPERSRGFLKVDMEICTACLACMIDCPIDCILIKTERNKETKERFLTQFDIDIAKCMFCGLCTEPCPTGAIHFTLEFEKSTEDINELLFMFVPEGEKIVPYIAPKKEKETEVCHQSNL